MNIYLFPFLPPQIIHSSYVLRNTCNAEQQFVNSLCFNNLISFFSFFPSFVRLQGRPYLDKMKWDRTEMLYWLSEERKQQGIQYEAITKGIPLPLKSTKLEPISMAKPVSWLANTPQKQKQMTDWKMYMHSLLFRD